MKEKQRGVNPKSTLFKGIPYEMIHEWKRSLHLILLIDKLSYYLSIRASLFPTTDQFRVDESIVYCDLE